MKSWIISCFLLLLIIPTRAQIAKQTLDVVCWNLEWFGATSAGPADDNLQEANAKKIMRWLNADIYGLCEIVDTARLRRLVDSLGNNEFDFVIAPYCSGNTTGTGNSWLTGQKLAFVYRKSIFSNVSARGLMRNSSTAYNNWASGRFPYMLTATVSLNNISRNMHFIMVHGKAGSTESDYNRRLAGANELKDTLDIFMSNQPLIIMGDYNDALHTSIYGGASVSSYISLVRDSTDDNHYKSITLPLGLYGEKSMISYPNVIDNVIISNEVAQFYRSGSVKIITNVTDVVPDYETARNTSDHYPVFSSYDFSNMVTGLNNLQLADGVIKAYPNPFVSHLSLENKNTLTQVVVRLTDINGKEILTRNFNAIPAGTSTQLTLPGNIAPGIYFLNISSKQGNKIFRLVK